jgi:hypothetical protein
VAAPTAADTVPPGHGVQFVPLEYVPAGQGAAERVGVGEQQLHGLHELGQLGRGVLQAVQALGLRLHTRQHRLLDLGCGLNVVGPRATTPAQQKHQQHNSLHSQRKPQGPK